MTTSLTDSAMQVAYAWAVSLGGDPGAQLLVKLGLVEQAIEYAMEEGAFEHAFDLCRGSLKHKLPEVRIPSPLHRIFLPQNVTIVKRIADRLH